MYLKHSIPKQPAIATTRFARGADWLCYQISPRWGARRYAARLSFEAAGLAHQRFAAAWEAADEEEKRGKNWLASKLSPDAALEESLTKMRQRSRDLVRNDGYAAGAVEGLVCNVVGCGIHPQARLDHEILGITEELAETIAAELEAVFERWSQAVDPSGTMSFFDLERLAVRTWHEDGEAFLVMSDVGRADSPIPLVLEVVDPDRVETPPHLAGDKRVRMGIEKDATGRVLRYWIRKKHPGDTVDTSEEFEPVDAARVIHLFEKCWPGQSRGVPWLAPVENTIKDLKDYREAELIGAQVGACFAAFITGPNSNAAGMGRVKSTAASGANYEEIRPGAIYYLDQQQQVETASPNRPGGGYASFVEMGLRGIAAGLNYVYEMLAKAWGKANYASTRAALIDGRIVFRAKQQLVRLRMLGPIWRRLVEEAVIIGETSIDPTAYHANPWPWQAHAWIAPGWPWVDPVKEVAAARNAVDGNLSTLQEECASRGIDWEDLLYQRRREVRLQKKLGVVPPMAPGGGPGPGQPDPTADDEPVDEDGEPIDAEEDDAADAERRAA